MMMILLLLQAFVHMEAQSLAKPTLPTFSALYMSS